MYEQYDEACFGFWLSSTMIPSGTTGDNGTGIGAQDTMSMAVDR